MVEKKTSTEGVPATKAAVRKRTTKAGRAVKVRTEIMGLRDQIEQNYLGLAELLAEVHNKEYYLDYGFKSFAEYSEVELETKYRKAMYFVDIWNRTKDLKISKAKLKKVGWTKAKEIVGAMTEDNADELLDMAQEKSTEELREEMKTREDHPAAGSRTATDRVSYQTLRLKMTTSEADVISSAIEEAKKSTESDNDVTALELVCMEWMQEHEDAAPPSLESIVEFTKTVFGVTLVEKGGARATKAREKKEAEAKAKAEEEAEAAEVEAEEVEEETAESDEKVEAAEDSLEELTTKKALREYIKAQGLEVSIKRGQTVEDIKDNIRTAEDEDEKGDETETKKEPTAAEKKAAAAKKKKAAAAKKKKEAEDEGDDADGKEPEEDDINAILGID